MDISFLNVLWRLEDNGMTFKSEPDRRHAISDIYYTLKEKGMESSDDAEFIKEIIKPYIK